MPRAVKVKRFRCIFKSVGNPDFGQYAPVSEPERCEGETVAEVVAAYRAYCVKWNMGGGNETRIPVNFTAPGAKPAFVIFSGQACHPKEREAKWNTPRPLTRRECAALDGVVLSGDEPKCWECGDLLAKGEGSHCRSCRVCRDCYRPTDRQVNLLSGSGRTCLGFLCEQCDGAVAPTQFRIVAHYFRKGQRLPDPEAANFPAECDRAAGEVSAVGPVAKEAALRRLLELRKAAFLLEREVGGQDSDGVFVSTERRFK